MLTVVLMFLEEFAPNLADDPTIKHAIYIVLALIIAVFAWRKRQTTMAQLHSPTNIVLTNGNVMVVESSSAAPMSPYTPSAASYTPPVSHQPLHIPRHLALSRRHPVKADSRITDARAISWLHWMS